MCDAKTAAAVLRSRQLLQERKERRFCLHLFPHSGLARPYFLALLAEKQKALNIGHDTGGVRNLKIDTVLLLKGEPVGHQLAHDVYELYVCAHNMVMRYRTGLSLVLLHA